MSIRKLLTFASLAIIVGVLVSGQFAGGIEPGEDLRATLLLGGMIILIATGASYMIAGPGYGARRLWRLPRPETPEGAVLPKGAGADDIREVVDMGPIVDGRARGNHS